MTVNLQQGQKCRQAKNRDTAGIIARITGGMAYRQTQRYFSLGEAFHPYRATGVNLVGGIPISCTQARTRSVGRSASRH